MRYVNSLFSGSQGLIECNLINLINEKTINISEIFNECSSLNNIDTNNWNISNVTDISHAFSSCENLTSLDVSNWDTGKVTDMSGVFSRSNNLINLDVSNWDMGNVTNVAEIFFWCENLTNLDVSNWNTNNIINMYGMFDYCKNLTTLDVSNWNTNNVINMQGVFHWCENLTNLDISNWNTNNVIDIRDMFHECENLTSLDVSNWNTSNIIDMTSAFRFCTNLTTLDVSNWNTNNVINMHSMFECCNSLTNLDVSNWNINKVTCIDSLFCSCKNLTNLDVSNWNTSNVIDTSFTFRQCEKLTTLNISNWNTSKITDMRQMFYACKNLITLNLSNWNVGNLTNIEEIFSGCYNLTNLDLNNWNTINVTNMKQAFYVCRNLTSLNINNWNMNSVTNMEYAFYGCRNLDLSSYATIVNAIPQAGHLSNAYFSNLGLNKNKITSAQSDILATKGYLDFLSPSEYLNITYDVGTGTISKNLDIGRKNHNYSTFIEEPLLQHYEFKGWLYNSNLYQAGDIITLGSIDTTLIAQYQEGGTLITSVPYNKEIRIKKAGKSVYFKFIPSVTGMYNFYSTDTDGGTKGYLYDNNWTELANDTNYFGAFNLKYFLIAGNTYYLEAKLYSDSDMEGYMHIYLEIDNLPITISSIPYTHTFNTVDTFGQCFSFIPTTSQIYIFSNNWNNIKIYLYDSNGNLISSATKSLVSDLIANQQYYWLIKTTSGEDSNVIVQLKEDTSQLVISSVPYENNIAIEAGELKYFKFTPEISGSYKFYSTGNYDTYGYLYDSNRSEITHDDDSGEERNFLITYNLTAGTTYYWGARFYSSSQTGTPTIHLEQNN